jgi:cytochrome c oxidase subunit 1
MNNWSFWIMPFAFTLLLSTLFTSGGGPAGGWTLYPPLVLQTGEAFPFVILAVHMMGISSIMGAINVIATILNLRAPGMTLMKMPLFVWTWLITAFLLIAVMPVLAGRGDHAADRQVFWHQLLQRGRRRRPGDVPAYFLVLRPSRGLHHDPAGVRDHFPDHSDLRPQAAVWLRFDGLRYLLDCVPVVHRLGASHVHSGMPLAGELFFMYATMLIAVPTGVKVFNWVSTMWRGAMTFETPMLFAIAFVILFTIGGFSGLMLAIAPADFQYHDTYFVVAHFHYVLVPGAVFSIMAAAYYWLPKWTGHMYNERLGKFHFWLSVVGVNVLFFPQHFLGLAGMPRRIPDYALQFTEFNMISTVGAFLFGLSQLLFLYNVIQTIRGGAKATDQVWEGAAGIGMDTCHRRRLITPSPLRPK